MRLGIPIYGCDPLLIDFGNKSGSRKIFLRAGVPMPPGNEDLKTHDDIIHSLAALKDSYPGLKKSIIKLNDGFSGEGNAIIHYPDHLKGKELSNWIHLNLYSKLAPVAKGMDSKSFLGKFKHMKGVVEAFIDGNIKASPSVQCRINPRGDVDIISTHDQVLAGESAQAFVGAHFPANESYRVEIAAMSKSIAEELKKEGVTGRFSIDFISIKEKNSWRHYAIEINLRKGGTTHPFLMLQFLTNGHYDESTGLYQTPDGQSRYYYSSDNLQADQYRGLTP